MNKKPESQAITEQTLIPVSLLVVIISALVLGVIHVQSIASKADHSSIMGSANAAEIKDLKSQDERIISTQNELTLEISTRLARIEGALGLPEYKRAKK
jgi:hypothetical protein